MALYDFLHAYAALLASFETWHLSLPFGFGACLLLLVLLIVSLHGPVMHAADTITVEHPLSGNQRLVSRGGKFAVGFFQPAGGAPDKWYLAVWYNKLSKPTSVWMANRAAPVSNPNSSRLAISDDGNMVLLDGSRSPVWSTNITGDSSSTAASSNSTVVGLILDTGNLVLVQASNLSNLLWQSFDEPTSAMLPGMKLSRNKVTGKTRRLVSWKSSTDPSPGFYSFGLDPDGSNQYVLQWNNSHEYWATGNWTGTMFTGIPEMAPANAYPNSLAAYEYVDNDKESYFVYWIKGDAVTAMFVMDVPGQFTGVVWAEAAQDWITFFTKPKAQCDAYSICGRFSLCTTNAVNFCSCLRGFRKRRQGDWEYGDPNAGCVRNVELRCKRSGPETAATTTTTDGFYPVAAARLPDNACRATSTGDRDCRLACLSNCSCTAYSYYSGGCSLWHGDLINLQDGAADGSTAQSIYIRLAASEISGPKASKKRIVAAATGGAIAVVTLLVVAGAASRYFVSRNRRRRLSRVGGGSLVALTHGDLQYVTKNFSDRLGSGSFGTVFKGTLADATAVAVKKLQGVRQGEKQFRAEVSTIGTIQHVNLIRLLGFCSQAGSSKMLVYEYMPNSSLDRHLFRGSGSAEMLSWSTRHQVALGVAKGLAYLHENCRDCIIHCDIKPENVLLDASFVPKVADFGLAKIMARDFSRVLTSTRGTIGYLAPEWIAGTAITAKADAFSYGMMLFEIITGRRNFEQGGESTVETFIPVLIAKEITQGNIKSLLGYELDGDAEAEEVERACKVACWCVQDKESSRPTMGEVVRILEGSVSVSTPPVPRYLQIGT